MYIYICVCICVFALFSHTCVCVCEFACVRVCVTACMRTCACACVRACVHPCVRAVCVHVNVCMHAPVYYICLLTIVHYVLLCLSGGVCSGSYGCFPVMCNAPPPRHLHSSHIFLGVIGHEYTCIFFVYGVLLYK